MGTKKHVAAHKDHPKPAAPPAEPVAPAVEPDVPEVDVDLTPLDTDPTPAIGTPSPTTGMRSAITIAEIAARLGAGQPSGWGEPVTYRRLVARAIILLNEAKEQGQDINPDKFRAAQ
jgi:hypothetical protein